MEIINITRRVLFTFWNKTETKHWNNLKQS